jgi:hypothetical protein
VIAATIIGLGRIPRRFRLVAAAAPLAAALVCLAATPPIPGEQDFVFGGADSPPRVAAMTEAIELVPASVAVSTTNRIGGHVSARRHVYLFPERARADWAVVDTRDAWTSVAGERVDQPRFLRLLEQLDRDTRWRLVFDDEDVRVYRRTE